MPCLALLSVALNVTALSDEKQFLRQRYHQLV
jgi:hypothetical protein